jgi:serine/threonine protein kinase
VDDRTKIDHHFNTRANLVALPNGNRNDSYRPLREILTGCLRFNPKQRPSIDETLVMIKQHRSKDPQNPEFVEDFRKAAWMEFYDPLGKKVNPVDLRDTRDYVSMKNIPENEDESEESEAS